MGKWEIYILTDKEFALIREITGIACNMTIWTWKTPKFNNKSIKLGRERLLITREELETVILLFLVDSMNTEKCQILLSI